MSGGRRLFRDIGTQATGNYVSTVARVVRGFVIAGILGPANMGVVAIGNLLLNYAQYADIGIAQGLNREVPMDLGRGDKSSAEAWVWYGLVAKVAAGLLVVFGVLIWLATPFGRSQPVEIRWVVTIASATSVAAGIVLVMQIVSRGRGDFVGASVITVLLAFTNLVAGIVGAVVAGPIGVATGVLLASILASVYGVRRVRPRGFTGIRLEKVKQLVRVGVPLALLTFIGFNLENVDQLVILALLDRESLGLYTIVIQAGGLLTLTGLSVSNVVGPRLLRRYATNSSIGAIADLTWKPALGLSAVVPMLVCLAWIVGPFLIQLLLPAYVASIAALKIYMAAMYFLCVNLGVSTTLLALGKHRLNIPIMIAAIVFNVVVDVVLVGWIGLGIEGVALGSLATYAVYWSAHTGLVRWQFERDLVRVMKKNFQLAVPGLMLAAFLAISYANGTLGQSAPLTDSLFVLAAAGVGFLQARSLGPDLWSLIRGANG